MKSYSDRKEITEWKDEIKTRSPFLNNGKLNLSKSDYNPDLMNCDLIIINDFNSKSELKAIENQMNKGYNGLVELEKRTDNQTWGYLKHTQYFNLVGSQRKFEIFQLKLKDNNIELHLHYDLMEIGEPKRENFKLCNLEMNVPTEIKINGKLDHSMSRGKERKFIEHCYIFHLIGETNEFEFIKEPFEGTKKRIPKPIKTVDLMKVLY